VRNPEGIAKYTWLKIKNPRTRRVTTAASCFANAPRARKPRMQPTTIAGISRKMLNY
jgi:hypothetical protein